MLDELTICQFWRILSQFQGFCPNRDNLRQVIGDSNAVSLFSGLFWHWNCFFALAQAGHEKLNLTILDPHNYNPRYES